MTKARIPMLFVVLFGYLILLWTGIFPTDIIESSNLAAFAALIPAPLVVHMGTLIPFDQIKEQYKSVLIALAGNVVAIILIFMIRSEERRVGKECRFRWAKYCYHT